MDARLSLYVSRAARVARGGAPRCEPLERRGRGASFVCRFRRLAEIFSDDAAGRSEYHKRFFQEAKAAGKLTHPHIVTTYDFGEEDGIAYLAMELLEGTELRKRMLDGDIAPADASRGVSLRQKSRFRS